MLEEARLQLETSNKHNKPDDDLIICECLCISVEIIRDFFKKNGTDLSLLSKELGLGSGCSSCLRSVDNWLDKI